MVNDNEFIRGRRLSINLYEDAMLDIDKQILDDCCASLEHYMDEHNFGISKEDIINATSLPTAEEYAARFNSTVFYSGATEWSEPKYQCPKCDGGMCRNEMIILMSNPPKYKYQCNKCGYIDYQLG